MSNISIQVENIGKKYSIAPQARYQRFSELLQNSLEWGLRCGFPRTKPSGGERSVSNGEFWALSDVSFDVKEGEVLGIIGSNGAGKSTLLKILSRITEPTSGRFGLRGRVSSLLEVGTGFHPELTGRENIYLNGAVLGMTGREIRQKFDEIVSFAGVENLLDTRVKYYSSGMHVRLGFAVAAHLDPEILIVDEVLAVGDAAFQKQCLGKMKDVTDSGRTVLFVSHNMATVRALCTHCLWLHEGRNQYQGDTSKVVQNYLSSQRTLHSSQDLEHAIHSLKPDPAFRLLGVEILQDGCFTVDLDANHPIRIDFKFQAIESVPGLRIYFDICDENDDLLIRSFHDEHADGVSVMQPGVYQSTAIIPACLLGPREYTLRIHGSIFNVRHCISDEIAIRLNLHSSAGINRAYPADPLRSKLQPFIEWQTYQEAS